MTRYLVLSGDPPVVWLPSCANYKLHPIGIVVGPRSVLWSMTQWKRYRAMLKRENPRALDCVRLVEVKL